MLCCVCTRDWPDSKCHTIALTDEEKAYLARSTGEETTSLTYCNPCWRLLSDRVMGAQLIKSNLQIHLRQQGAGDAERRSQEYLNRLLGLTAKPKT